MKNLCFAGVFLRFQTFSSSAWYNKEVRDPSIFFNTNKTQRKKERKKGASVPDLSGKGLHQGLGLLGADWRASLFSTVSQGCPKRSLPTDHCHSRANMCSSTLCCIRASLGLREPILVLWGFQLVKGNVFVHRNITVHWIKLLREAVESPSLERFYPTGQSLSSTIQMLCWAWAGGSNTDIDVSSNLAPIMLKNLQWWEMQTKNAVGFEFNYQAIRTVDFIILLQFHRVFHLS